MHPYIKYPLYFLGIFVLLVSVAGCSFTLISPQFGAEAEGQRREKMRNSPHYHDGAFQNTVPTSMEISFRDYMKLISKQLFGDDNNKTPDHTLPVQMVDMEQLTVRQDTATVITWLGHSAFLVEIDGKRLLLDPMLGDIASPISFIGPKRFSKLPLAIEDLPELDAILISHDHYDHLDYGSIKALTAKTRHFYVALGVGAHLERWGVPAAKITELDWWEEASFQGLTFAATPARHFSGRGLSDRMHTLWASWVILGKEDKIFFSGDSGYFDGFREIGDKYGPFDITLMESGQYNKLWPNIHMMPEQSVQAHIDLKGKLLLPIHWGSFALAMHPWNEPIERITQEADKRLVSITTPHIGEPVILHHQTPQQTWWKEYVDSTHR
ncbi:MBL fold metallo-hydrolase [Pontibacter sp. CAU 1760]